MATDIGSIRFTIEADSTPLNTARAAIQGLQNGTITATKVNDQFARSFVRVRSSANQAQRVVAQTTTRFRPMKGAVQQLGFQVQDLAVQLSSGTSAFVAFGQQGPQILSIFGPGGAVIGAVFAIAAAIGGTLFNALGRTEEETKTLIERTKELDLAYRDLTSTQKAGLQLELAKEEIERQKAIRETEKQIRSLENTMEQFNRGTQVRRGPNSPLTALISPEQANAAQENLIRVRAELEFLQDEGQAARDALDELVFGFEDTGEKARQATSEVEQLAESLQRQADTIRLDARETALYELARLQANGADEEAVRAAREQVNASFDRIDAYKREQDELENLRELTRITAQEDPLLGRVAAEGRGQSIIEDLRKEAETTRLSLDERLAAEREFNSQVQSLRDGLRLGTIESQEEFHALMQEAETRHNERMIEISGSFWEQWMLAARDNLENFNELSASVIDNFSSSFGDAFESVILDSENASEALKGLARTMIRSVVNAIGQMIAQWIALQAVQLALSAQATAASVAEAGVTAAAWAPAAAAASLGTAGANSVPAASGMATASAVAASLFASARADGGQVQRDIPFLVGERGPELFTPGQTGQVTSNKNMANGGDTNITQVLQLPGDIRTEVKQQIMEAMPIIRSAAVQAVLQAGNQGGPMARMVGRRS